ncbi:MAG: ABC transporter ATP-binding protein [Candidatus Dormibacteraeota bacterium]|nr:ABC transporter ATP-binding protein [Candidatus Dormibacteraeota bacterium]
MAEDAVAIAGVSKSFGSLKALDDISLQVKTGEVYGLLGPNGSGKTTLIRMIVGLLLPDSGSVQVLGTRMPNVAVLARVGYMTQQAALYPDLSVEENVLFFAAINNAEEQVEEALRFVELWDRRGSVITELSGGMRQRCSLACAIVHGPRLLLLDEPTVGLDPQLRIQFWEGFRVMTRSGIAIVVSSHVMDEAERCDRLGLVRDGKLLAEGTAASLRAQTGQATLEDAFLALAGVVVTEVRT